MLETSSKFHSTIRKQDYSQANHSNGPKYFYKDYYIENKEKISSEEWL
jgi:hypothetical protein